jgi:hypothetical protein
LRALEHSFTVRTNDRTLARYIDRVLGALFAPVEATFTYSLIDRGEDTPERYALYAGEEGIAFSQSGFYVLAMLLWRINRSAVADSDHVILHAGAVAIGGRAIVLPARSGSGKSTLVAGLVRAGAQYLTDEATAIDVQSLAALRYPRPISVAGDSKVALADLAPSVDPDVKDRYVGDDWHLDPRGIRSDSISAPAPPVLVVAPSYEAGVLTELTPMTRAEALVTLVEHSFNVNEHGRAGFETLAAVVQRCACYRLVAGDLDDAVRLVLDL